MSSATPAQFNSIIHGRERVLNEEELSKEAIELDMDNVLRGDFEGDVDCEEERVPDDPEFYSVDPDPWRVYLGKEENLSDSNEITRVLQTVQVFFVHATNDAMLSRMKNLFAPFRDTHGVFYCADRVTCHDSDHAEEPGYLLSPIEPEFVNLTTESLMYGPTLFPMLEDKGPALRVMDVFAGMGGFTMGMKAAGMQVCWAVENDTCPAEAYQHLFPDTVLFKEDVVVFTHLLRLYYEHIDETNVDQFDRDEDNINDSISDPAPQPGYFEVECIVDVRAKPMLAPSRFEWRDLIVEGRGQEGEEEVEEEDEDEEVEEVEGEYNFEVEYLVRWRHYDSAFDQWIPENEFSQRPTSLVTQYLDRKYGLTNIPRPGEVDVLIGGPPCQGVSTLNSWRMENRFADPRVGDALLLLCIQRLTHTLPLCLTLQNQMMFVMQSLGALLQVKYFVMENVPGLLSDLSFLRGIHDKFDSIEFDHTIAILSALHYGIPQQRSRVFILAKPRNAPWDLPDYPAPTHCALNVGLFHSALLKETLLNPFDVEFGLFAHTTAVDFLSDLPEFHLMTGHVHTPAPYRTVPRTVYQETLRGSCFSVSHHDSRGFSDRSALFGRSVPLSGGADNRDMPVDVQDQISEGVLRRRHGRVCRRIRWDEAVNTINRSPCVFSGCLMPNQMRILSIRELMRLQGFPDSVTFPSHHSLSDMLNCLGNAVPVNLGRAIAFEIRRAWKSHSMSTYPDNTTGVYQLELGRFLRQCSNDEKEIGSIWNDVLLPSSGTLLKQMEQFQELHSGVQRMWNADVKHEWDNLVELASSLYMVAITHRWHEGDIVMTQRRYRNSISYVSWGAEHVSKYGDVVLHACSFAY